MGIMALVAERPLCERLPSLGRPVQVSRLRVAAASPWARWLPCCSQPSGREPSSETPWPVH